MSELSDQKTDQLISSLKENIDNNKDIQMNAYLVRIPLLCKSVLDIHEILKELKNGQDKMDEKLDNKFVTKDSFTPVKLVVYGMVAIVLSGVLYMLLSSIGIKAQLMK